MKEKTLVDEIKHNARRDRARLEDLCDELLKLARNESLMVEELAKVALTEQLTKATDTLTRVNSQLVELAKIDAKKEMSKKDRENIHDSIFDEIQNDGPHDH